MRKLIYIILLSFVLQPIVAQSARDFIRLGNAEYRQKRYEKAETYYIKSVEKSPSFEAYYNLGNTYVMQQKDSIAFVNYMKADSVGTNDPMRRARNFHNMGNIWYAQGVAATHHPDGNAVAAFQKAVNLYKSSLRCNPDDNQTRYNLAMAQYQLKKNQNNDGENDDKKDEDKQDGGQHKKDEQNQNKDSEQQKQQQDDNEQKNQQNQKQEQEKDEMSDQTAEQLLKSAQQDEKSVQRKVNQTPANRRSLEKDW